MTATTRRSYSRSSSIAFAALVCILVFSNHGVESRSSSLSDKSSFVPRDANATTISNSSSSTTAPSTSTTASSSTQSSSNISAPTFTPISSNTSQPTTFTSLFGENSTSSQILLTSTLLILRTSTSVVTSTSIGSSSSSSSSPTPLVDPTPSATLVLTSPTSTFIDPSVSPTLSVSAASSSSSSSFWRNKAAIIAVFLIVTLIACGVIVILIVAFFKRRARREQRLHNQMFGHPKLDPATSSTHSSGPSINSAPMDAFSTREVGHESPLFFPVPVTQPPQVMASSTVQHTNYNASRYNPTSLPKITNSGPPVAFHNQAKRESAQPSIDSFYGAPARQSTDYKIYAL